MLPQIEKKEGFSEPKKYSLSICPGKKFVRILKYINRLSKYFAATICLCSGLYDCLIIIEATPSNGMAFALTR